MKKKAIKIVVPVIMAMLTIILIICCGSTISPSSDVIAQPTITTSTTVMTTVTTTKTKTTQTKITTTTTQNTKTKIKDTTTVTTTKEIVTTVAKSIVTNKQPMEEYIVYKPDTHYVHDNTCHWAKCGRIERIETTKGIESRKCSECNPEIEIVTEYVEPIPEVTINTNNNDRDLLAQIVWHEAGSDWIGTYDKAMVAAAVMNRVNDSRFPSTVYGVLTQPGQFPGFTLWTCTPTQSCYDAVDYYFNNVSSFGNHNSWYGDGVSNHFYYQ